MLTDVDLKIRRSNSATEQAHAWFLPGNNPADWILALHQANLPASEFEVLLVPSAFGNKVSAGAIILPRNGTTTLKVPSHWTGYRVIAGRILLPSDAMFDPPMHESEIDALFPDKQERYLFEPTLGLIVYTMADILTFDRFLFRPPVIQSSWSHAQIGETLAPRVLSLEAQRQSFDDIMDALQDEIGSKNRLLDELPRSPGESLIAQAAFGLQLPLVIAGATIGSILAGLFGSSGKSPLLKSLNDFFETHKQVLDSLRHRSIDRLMKKLDADPDAGLHYALPLTGPLARGLAKPSGFLSWRLTNFTLHPTSGATDYWHLSFDVRRRLLQKYLELAARELSLGRHRRAAYIYANLLGNFGTAATILEEAKYYTEAATIYRDKLYRGVDAARCFRSAGQYKQAIQIFSDHSLWESVGDIYQQLNDPELAAEAFKKEIAKLQKSGDIINMARLHDQKLGNTIDAIAELRRGAFFSPQSARCTEELFLLYSRDSRHDEALTFLDSLECNTLSSDVQISVTEVLASQANQYPSVKIKQAILKTTHRIISRLLGDRSFIDRERLVAILPRLVPSDLLLARDCRRYLANLPIRRQTQLRRPSNKLAVNLILDLNLSGAPWTSAFAIGDSILLAKLALTHVAIASVSAVGQVTEYTIPFSGKPVGPFQLITLTSGKSIIHLPGATLNAPPSSMPGIEVNSIILPQHLSIATHENGTVWALQSNDAHYECQIFNGFRFIDSFQVTGINRNPSTTNQNPTIRFLRPEIGLILDNGTLYAGYLRNGVEEISVTVPIRTFAVPSSHVRPRVATFHDNCVQMIWFTNHPYQAEIIEEDLYLPLGTFAPSGHLVVASQEECRVYESIDQKQTLVCTFAGTKSVPTAVIPLPRIGGFAILCESGHLSVFSAQMLRT